MSAAENEQVTQTQRHLQTETTNETEREPEHAFDTPKTRTINFYAFFLFGELKRKIILFGTDNKQNIFHLELVFGEAYWNLESSISNVIMNYAVVLNQKKLAAIHFNGENICLKIQNATNRAKTA